MTSAQPAAFAPNSAPDKSAAVNIADVRVDGGTQSRAAINRDVVSDYAEALAGGASFPPIVVFFDGAAYWLADGFHRYEAYSQAQVYDVPADIRQGTQRDAVLFSVGANSAHGLRRTNDDKRRAVLTLLSDPEWSANTDQWVADRCGVGRAYVSKMRRESILSYDDKIERAAVKRVVQRNGKTYEMDVANIGSSRPKARPLTQEEDAVLRLTFGETVYLLSAGDRVKVGYSRHGARHRVEQLLTSTPRATVIAVADGTMAQERAVHAALECDRDAGEWFVCSVEDALEAMRSCGLVPQLHPPAVAPAPSAPEPETALPQLAAAPEATAPPLDDDDRREIARLTVDAMVDEIAGLRADLIEAKAQVRALTIERDNLKAKLKEATSSDMGRALGNAQRRADQFAGRMNEYMATAKRLEFRLKAAEKRVKELEETPIAMGAL